MALISFDGQTIIATNQIDPEDASQGTSPDREALNTIDAGSPTSSVQSLPDESPLGFFVAWTGSDDPGGSGVATFDIYISDNGGPFTLWLDDTSSTSASFTGVLGHEYAFYSVATDHVGHEQPTPTGPQATTTVTSNSIRGTDGDDAIHVIRASDRLNIFLNTPIDGAPTFVVPLAGLPPLSIDAGDGNDSLTVNSGGEATLGVARLIYNAGTGANNLMLETGSARIDSTADAGGTLASTIQSGAHLSTDQLNQNGLTLADAARVTLLPGGATSKLTGL